MHVFYATRNQCLWLSFFLVSAHSTPSIQISRHVQNRYNSGNKVMTPTTNFRTKWGNWFCVSVMGSRFYYRHHGTGGNEEEEDERIRERKKENRDHMQSYKNFNPTVVISLDYPQWWDLNYLRSGNRYPRWREIFWIHHFQLFPSLNLPWYITKILLKPLKDDYLKLDFIF